MNILRLFVGVLATSGLSIACSGAQQDAEILLNKLAKDNPTRMQCYSVMTDALEQRIRHIAFTSDGELFRRCLPHLKELKSLRWLGVRQIELDAADRECIIALPLTEFDYSWNADEKVTLGWLSKSKTLEQLSLRQNKRLSDDDILPLAEAPKLNKLDLLGTNVTGRCFAETSGFLNLKVLDLTASQVDDVGLKGVSSLKKLMVLHVGQSRCSEQGLEHIVAMHYLIEFWGEGSKKRMTQIGLAHYELKKKAREAGEDVPPDALSPFSYYIHDSIPKPTIKEIEEANKYQREHLYNQPAENNDTSRPIL